MASPKTPSLTEAILDLAGKIRKTLLTPASNWDYYHTQVNTTEKRLDGKEVRKASLLNPTTNTDTIYIARTENAAFPGYLEVGASMDIRVKNLNEIVTKAASGIQILCVLWEV